MSFIVEQDTGDIVISGTEKGIAPSPHLGIADIKNINITSLPGEAAVNYNRLNQLVPNFAVGTGTFTGDSSSYVTYTGTPALQLGTIVNVQSSSISGLSTGIYWISGKSGTGYNLSASYNGSSVTGMGSTGSANFTIILPHQLVQGAYEQISATQYRYYMLDSYGLVWVSDPNVYSGNWTFIDSLPAEQEISGGHNITHWTGLAVSQGILWVFGENRVFWQFTKLLTTGAATITPGTQGSGQVYGWFEFTNGTAGYLNTPVGSSNSHYALLCPANNGSIYLCDGSFVDGLIGSVGGVKTGSTQVVPPSQFTFATCTPDGTADISFSITSGVTPVANLPVAFFPSKNNSLPGTTGGSTAGLLIGQVYYLKSVTNGAFQIADSIDDTAYTAINANGGALFYMTTAYPNAIIDGSSNSVTPLWAYNNKVISLSYYETSNCLAFINNGSSQIVIGTTGRNLYTWTISSTAQPSGVLSLPENNCFRILNVDNILYAFSGNKGNIYITNGITIAGAMTVPDYIANQYGTNQDPWFVWGDVMFLRGRVWFSIQDQNAGNTTGNCGGVWSFVPTQNLFLGQDQGVSLHLEHQNSYGTYNGKCDVLLPSQTQLVNGAQYYSGWSNVYTGGTAPNNSFGIDGSGTVPYNATSDVVVGVTVPQYGQIDTDIVPIGTFLKPFTASTIEYKLSRPMVSGEQVEILYRPDLTSQFTDLGQGTNGNGIDNTAGHLSYPFPQTLQESQWLQFRIKLTSTTTTPSFLPFTELRIRRGT